jgi:hypothetical protein
MFCISLFVLLYFFFWPLRCLFFFDVLILITPLVSSNSSYYIVRIQSCCSSSGSLTTDGSSVVFLRVVRRKRTSSFYIGNIDQKSTKSDIFHYIESKGSLFLLLYYFVWPLSCLFFFDVRILITPLLSSNSSFYIVMIQSCFMNPKVIKFFFIMFYVLFSTFTLHV